MVLDRILRLHRSVLAHRDEHVHNLSCELARGREADRLRLWEGVVDAAQHGEDECSSLACTGLALADHVRRWVCEEQRKSAFLDLGRLGEAHLVDTLEELLREAELFEGLGAVER